MFTLWKRNFRKIPKRKAFILILCCEIESFVCRGTRETTDAKLSEDSDLEFEIRLALLTEEGKSLHSSPIR